MLEYPLFDEDLRLAEVILTPSALLDSAAETSTSHGKRRSKSQTRSESFVRRECVTRDNCTHVVGVGDAQGSGAPGKAWAIKFDGVEDVQACAPNASVGVGQQLVYLRKARSHGPAATLGECGIAAAVLLVRCNPEGDLGEKLDDAVTRTSA